MATVYADMPYEKEQQAVRGMTSLSDQFGTQEQLKVVEAWVPPIIRRLLGRTPGRVWLCGGALRSIFDNTRTSDYDLFFRDGDAFNDAQQFLKNEFKNCLNPTTSHAVTFISQGVKIQLVCMKWFPSAHDCIASFDFTCTRMAFWQDEQSKLQFYAMPEAVEHALQRWLAPANLKGYAYDSLEKRVDKYKSIGYTVSSKVFEEFFKNPVNSKSPYPNIQFQDDYEEEVPF